MRCTSACCVSFRRPTICHRFWPLLEDNLWLCEAGMLDVHATPAVAVLVQSFFYLHDPVRPVVHADAGPFVLSRVRIPALMDLYIPPLYVLVSKILSSILNSSTSILYIIIYPLYLCGIYLSLYLNISMCNLVLKNLLRRI
jgi:hypothetical protein